MSATPHPSCVICKGRFEDGREFPVSDRTTVSHVMFMFKLYEHLDHEEFINGSICGECHNLIDQIDCFQQNVNMTKDRLKERRLMKKHNKKKSRSQRKTRYSTKQEELDNDVDETIDGAIGGDDLPEGVEEGNGPVPTENGASGSGMDSHGGEPELMKIKEEHVDPNDQEHQVQQAVQAAQHRPAQLPQAQLSQAQLPEGQLPPVQLPAPHLPPQGQLPPIQLPPAQLAAVQLPSIQLPQAQLPSQLLQLQLPPTAQIPPVVEQ